MCSYFSLIALVLTDQVLSLSWLDQGCDMSVSLGVMIPLEMPEITVLKRLNFTGQCSSGGKKKVLEKWSDFHSQQWNKTHRIKGSESATCYSYITFSIINSDTSMMNDGQLKYGPFPEVRNKKKSQKRDGHLNCKSSTKTLLGRLMVDFGVLIKLSWNCSD